MTFEVQEHIHHSLENLVEIRCKSLSCGWELIWHQFGLLCKEDKDDIVCEKCGGEVSFHHVNLRKMTRLKNESRTQHYTKERVNKELDMV